MFGLKLHITEEGGSVALCGKTGLSRNTTRTRYGCHRCMTLSFERYRDLVENFNLLTDKRNDMADRLNLILSAASSGSAVTSLGGGTGIILGPEDNTDDK